VTVTPSQDSILTLWISHLTQEHWVKRKGLSTVDLLRKRLAKSQKIIHDLKLLDK
jgi:hypothetical protein